MGILIDSRLAIDVINKAYNETKKGSDFLRKEDAMIIIACIKSDLADIALDALDDHESRQVESMTEEEAKLKGIESENSEKKAKMSDCWSIDKKWEYARDTGDYTVLSNEEFNKSEVIERILIAKIPSGFMDGMSTHVTSGFGDNRRFNYTGLCSLSDANLDRILVDLERLDENL